MYKQINESIKIIKMSLNRLESCKLNNMKSLITDINSLIDWINNNYNKNIELNNIKEVYLQLDKYENSMIMCNVCYNIKILLYIFIIYKMNKIEMNIKNY